MLTIYVMLAVFTIGNALWTVHNVRETAVRKKILDAACLSAEQMKTEAADLLRKAKAVTTSDEHKVCSECGRITVKHETENGKTTCVNCLADLANGYKRVKVNG